MDSDGSITDLAFSMTNDYMIKLDDQWRVVQVNKSFLHVFNLHQEDIKGSNFFELCKTLNISSSEDLDLKNISDVFIYCTETKEGHELTWQIHKLNSSLTVGYFVIGKYAQYRNILNKYLQLETMINHMPCNVYWMDKDLTHIGCNQNVLDMLDLKKDKYIGSTYEELSDWANWPEGLGDSFKGDDKEVLATGEPKLNVEEPAFKDANGRNIYLLTSRVALRDTSGTVVGVAGISTDITQLKEALKNSELAQRKQADFISNMSHDIKTPITGMIGLLQQMYEQSNDEKFKILVKELVETTASLLSLLHDSIEAIKIRTGKFKFTPTSFDFHQLVEDSCRLIKPSLLLKKLDFTFCYPKDCPDCFIGDRNLINRILVNLLGNAVKFTEKGRISLSVKVLERSADNYILEIRVSDSGVGIPREKTVLIFEEFTRLEPSHEGKYEGHGIGLFTVKNYIEKMNGTIRVRSIEGKGSSFAITLPLKVSKEQNIPNTYVDYLEVKKKITSNSERKEKVSVLLVEDTKTAGFMVKNMLEKYGAVVDWVETGKSALDSFKKKPYHIVLLDIGLPDMDGLTVAETIRHLPDKAGVSVTIIGLSAHAEKTHFKKCMKAGMDSMISKPLSPDQAQEIATQLPGF